MELKTKANICKYFNKYEEVDIDVEKIDSSYGDVKICKFSYKNELKSVNGDFEDCHTGKTDIDRENPQKKTKDENYFGENNVKKGIFARKKEKKKRKKNLSK